MINNHELFEMNLKSRYGTNSGKIVPVLVEGIYRQSEYDVCLSESFEILRVEDAATGKKYSVSDDEYDTIVQYFLTNRGEMA
jgi:hypothetical protein